MAENCEVCGVKLYNPKYKYCLKCIDKVNTQNLIQDVLGKLESINISLKHLNWNAGSLVKQQRLYYLFQICETYGEDRNEIRKIISQYFAQDLEKDVKQLKQIKEEQEK